MKSAGRDDALGQAGDRQRRGVGAQQGAVGEVRLDLGEDLRLDLRVLEDGLDHEVGAGGVRRVGRSA